MTGGAGRLGTELRALLPQIVAPLRDELDITDARQVMSMCERLMPSVVVHAAAFTDVRGAETARERCWDVNVNGTRNIARAANATGAHMVHISTDYVFSGEKGMYRENDVPGPVANYYALTKLVAEQVVRASCEVGSHLVIRTSFRPRKWPYPTAFTDVYTSQDYVDVIAPMIAEAIANVGKIGFDTLHVATERKTVYELAKRRAPNVTPVSSQTAPVAYPKDVSLNCDRWQQLQTTFA